MKITPHTYTIRQLIEGYTNDIDEGVHTMNGNLIIRPPYQREFIYTEKRQQAVINSILNGFPINVFYFAPQEDKLEVLDGQQRIISICRFATDNLYISTGTPSKPDSRLFNSLSKKKQNAFLDYEIMVYLCEGDEYDKLNWFRTINVPGIELTNQELRNIAFTGPWLTAAKKYFFRGDYGINTSVAYKKGYGDYLSGTANRQEWLETALKWIAPNITEYMSAHKNDDTADELIAHFETVIEWAKKLFPYYRREMKSVDWGALWRDWNGRTRLERQDPKEIEARVVELMSDDDVRRKSGIYPYMLTGEEKYLNVRQFTNSMKRSAYETQDGICAKCTKKFDMKDMQADHITPWSRGGKTEADNLQMLCKDCNRRKSDA